MDKDLKNNKKLWWGITLVNFFYSFDLITNQIEMRITIFAPMGNQVRIIWLLENDKVVSDMVFLLLFREQLDLVTSYFVRFIFFLQNRVYQQQPHLVFFTEIIKTNFTNQFKLVEIKRMETNHFGRNNRPESLKQFHLCQQTETCPVHFNLNHSSKWQSARR